MSWSRPPSTRSWTTANAAVCTWSTTGGGGGPRLPLPRDPPRDAGRRLTCAVHCTCASGSGDAQPRAGGARLGRGAPPRPALAPDAKPMGDPRVGGHGPTDRRRPGRALLPAVSGPLPDAGARASAARRGAAAGAGLGYNRRAVNLHGCAWRWSTTTAGLCRRTWRRPAGAARRRSLHGPRCWRSRSRRHRGGRHQRRAGAGPVGGAPARCRRGPGAGRCARAARPGVGEPGGRGARRDRVPRRRPRCASCPCGNPAPGRPRAGGAGSGGWIGGGRHGQPRFEGSGGPGTTGRAVCPRWPTCRR